MDIFSRCLLSSPPLKFPSKTLKSAKKSHIFLSNYTPICSSKLLSFNSLTSETRNSTLQNDTDSRTTHLYFVQFHRLFIKNQFPLLFVGLSSPLSCLASETGDLPPEEVSNKINLESVLVSIDNFFNRYPFFVATVAFIWLVAIPLIEEYLQKYKYVSAINAFNKLKDDANCQLLDIRESKSVASLGSPNLKRLNKSAVQVEFREGDEEGFVRRVLENFGDPADTCVCVLDDFDGNSLKVAELLVKNGFEEAYAVRGGIRGKKGWQEIQETLLPLYVHVFPKKKLKHVNKNGGMILTDSSTDGDGDGISSSTRDSDSSIANKEFANENLSAGGGQRPLSPYPNYPDWRPPSSPTPSKPCC
ncbi:rhodanese-like domain-containing protein 4A, chloroplastic [Andrographis paniculata]|uniref:rhodanese-like domain-containing protein 4A, chloroplastic n=1 Tax=Andrographis paniculata TaxID=175694 RepID=UPI0021E7B4E5|nr:rhodanese-like domain-containing protein 4A, chloroplastic [Andrographis paniculata]